MFWKLRKSIADLIIDPRGVLKQLERDKASSPDAVGCKDVEWSWITANMPMGPGEALDFGNGGTNLSFVASQKGFNATAIDMQDIRWHYEHARLSFQRGDLLELPLKENNYDLIINCSTVEHVGLKGRYGVESKSGDGDFEAMCRLRDLAKTGGVMLLTIPVGQDDVFLPFHRIYGEKRLPLLLRGWSVRKEEYWIKIDGTWKSSAREKALSVKANSIFYSLGLFILEKNAGGK